MESHRLAERPPLLTSVLVDDFHTEKTTFLAYEKIWFFTLRLMNSPYVNQNSVSISLDNNIHRIISNYIHRIIFTDHVLLLAPASNGQARPMTALQLCVAKEFLAFPLPSADSEYIENFDSIRANLTKFINLFIDMFINENGRAPTYSTNSIEPIVLNQLADRTSVRSTLSASSVIFEFNSKFVVSRSKLKVEGSSKQAWVTFQRQNAKLSLVIQLIG